MTVELRANVKGFVFEVNTLPSGFLASVERRGLAASTAPTTEGFYCEPRETLASVVSAISMAGIELRGVRPSGASNGWRFFARPASGAHGRLTSLRSSTWLPTVPA
jgi:hypothetical protein